MQKALSTPVQSSDRFALFPDSARLEAGSLAIAGQDLSALVEQFGTPLYIYDRLTMDASVARYLDALRPYGSGAGSVTYAGKAFLCIAIAEWAEDHGLWLDCTGESEIRVALAAGVTPRRVLVHGVNKSTADLEAAIRHAGTIVVDNLVELDHLQALFLTTKHAENAYPQLWLRLLPGLAVQTHHTHTQTGQHDSKFGMTRPEILQAAALCRKHGLPLNGIHFHQGSNFRDPSPLLSAIDLGLDISREIGLSGEWHFSPGGGWGVAYHESELPHPDIEQYVELITGAVSDGCERRGLSSPHLHLEPGRSLIARAGVALYRVGAVKKRGGRTWLLTDGGMTDNPRHALYGSRYSALPVSGLEREWSELVHIAGPFCESGDILIEDLPMPKIQEGELIAIPVSGAYHLSMSSNYNGARRPAVVWLEDGTARLIQRRETIEDLLERDLSIRV